ncbi:MAG: Na(+)-translocating NADH-quinone reductase subunit A [Tannerella sp.]|jgi:Na+-transporting NADH:ubiquinone oxidoreductase subunit A|nr:Na(+)-translocating NADH-quinone reductase subunit A [Tannerella sp.]
MATVIKIKKGLDINLKGKASGVTVKAAVSDSYAIVPDHYTGVMPRVTVRPGDRVKAGSTLMTDKRYPEIRFVSPVSGEVTEVLRGEKRRVLRIEVKPDREIEYETFAVKPAASTAGSEEIKALLLEAGMWPYIKQRPYDRIAAPDVAPRDIFVTACHTAPLAPDFDYIVKGEEDALQAGLDALGRLTEGHVYLGVKKDSTLAPERVECVELDGPHPAGNAGVMINRICPVNKGETVWTLNAADVLFIGRLMLTGKADFSRLVALTGPEMTERGYVRAIAGCTVASLTKGRTMPGDRRIRLISGNVLTGAKVAPEDFLGAYDNQITAIPEGDDVDEFLGWGMPGFGKYSVSRSYFTWLAGRAREYVIDARIRGGRRAMIMSGEYDKVFPMDILPEYLLKAIIAFDIEKMENLGIYEVAPEDFALCEFVDTSKIEIQQIVRNGLDLLYREMN